MSGERRMGVRCGFPLKDSVKVLGSEIGPCGALFQRQIGKEVN